MLSHSQTPLPVIIISVKMKVEMSGKCFFIYCFLVLVLVSQQAASSMTNNADIQTKNTYSPVLCHSPRRKPLKNTPLYSFKKHA